MRALPRRDRGLRAFVERRVFEDLSRGVDDPERAIGRLRDRDAREALDLHPPVPYPMVDRVASGARLFAAEHPRIAVRSDGDARSASRYSVEAVAVPSTNGVDRIGRDEPRNAFGRHSD